jgi:hypothetical protein
MEMFCAASIKREIFDAGHALSAPMLEVMFHRFPRFGFAARYRRCPDGEVAPACDVALVHEGFRTEDAARAERDAALAPWRGLFGARLDRAAQLQFRFIVCLEGNDYATGLFWALQSNSVVLMPPPRWQTILHFGLKPWQHYIPLAEDLGDLEAKIAWGNAHVSACAAISAQACDFMRAQSDGARRGALDLAVLRRYCAMAAP